MFSQNRPPISTTNGTVKYQPSASTFRIGTMLDRATAEMLLFAASRSAWMNSAA
jgi:hypothetical protein